MSKFLLFFKKARVFLKYRFFTYKLRLLKFLGKFIPYFKPMTYTKKQALAEIRKYLKEHIDKFNRQTKNNITNESQIDEGEIITDYNEIDEGYFTSFKYSNAEDFICRLRYNVKYELHGVGYMEFKIFIDYFKKGNTKIDFQLETPFNKSTLMKYNELFVYIDCSEINNKILTILFNVN